jgi:hypothetical protein
MHTRQNTLGSPFIFCLRRTHYSSLSHRQSPPHPIMAARDVMGPAMGLAVEKKKKKRRRGPWTRRPNMCRITRCLVVRDSPPAPTAAWPARPRQNQRSGPGPHFYASAPPPHSAPNNCAMECERFPSFCLFFYLYLFLSLTVKL